jgi:CHAT domain-containing protein
MKAILGGDLIMDDDAREARLRTPEDKIKLANAQVIAFATHGLVTGDLGLGEPALALAAPKPGEKDDGFLTASEVLQIKLNADWVILSACNTASPDSDQADGLSGLSRAFFFAGAGGLLVSHWRVDDVATQALTTQAVRLRRAGATKAEALQKASLELIDGPDPRLAFPTAWGAFTLIGDPL